MRWNAGVSDTPIVIIDITGRCNLKCIHCWNADFIQNELDRDTVLKIIDAAPTDARIHFLGGEPLLHSKLDEFIERASNMEDMFLSLQMELLDENRVCQCQAGLSELGISIESSDKSVNDSIRGKGTFEKAWNAIKTAGTMISKDEVDMALTISTTAMSLNIRSIPNLLVSRKKLGFVVDNIIIDRLVPEGRASDDVSSLNVQENEWLDTAEAICSSWGKYPNLTNLVLKVPPLVHEYLTTKFNVFLRDSIIACPALQVRSGARICSDGKVFSCSREGLINRAKNNSYLPDQGKYYQELEAQGLNPFRLNDFRNSLDPLLSAPSNELCGECEWRDKALNAH